MSDLVKIYNPASAASLTTEQIDGLQKLTNDEIRELALAYPNRLFPTPYLLIIDSKKEVLRQIPNASTFENLYNLRVRNGLSNYVAFNFRANYRPVNVTKLQPKRTEVIDLSDEELMSLPGFRAKNEIFPAETVQVKKVKRVPKDK